jgi:dolichyl-phosphate-mannose-protein mannosyltransferase
MADTRDEQLNSIRGSKGAPPERAQDGDDSQRVLHLLLLFVVMLAAWYLRTRNLLYSTAFLDETLEIIFGRLFLANPQHPPYEQTLYWHYGWYLWPAMSAIADRIGGLLAVRYLAAICGVLTVFVTYLFSRRLFSPAVALASGAVFAFLGPAVFASRFATYDSITLLFLAVGLWLYARAWQEEESVTWFLSGCAFFLSFLGKYVVALYFPFLVLLCLRKGRKPFLFFSVPLTIFCALYALAFRTVLASVVRLVGAENTGFQATSKQLWQIYFVARADFWILLALSLLALIPAQRILASEPAHDHRGSLLLALTLWLGMAVIFGLQLSSSASDLRFFKHVTYSMLFLVPLAMEGLFRVLRRLPRKSYFSVATATVALLAVALGWLGNAWTPERLVFWPSLDPLISFFNGRISPRTQVLTNDLALRYYLDPTVPIQNVAGPFYFEFEGLRGKEAYAKGVTQGFFDYVALVGKGLEEGAFGMQAVIRPLLPKRYKLRLHMTDPTFSVPIELYERMDPPVVIPEASGPRVEIISPASEEVVRTDAGAAQLQGKVIGARTSWFIRVDVLTNRWYPQGEVVYPEVTTGAFSQTIFLGGRCNHIVRVRLFDEHGKQVAAASNFSIARANPDGSAPSCP